MKRAVILASLAAQMAFFVAFAAVVFELIGPNSTVATQPDVAQAAVENQIINVLDKYQVFVGTGVLGAIVHLIILQKGVFRESWFFSMSRALGWAWLPFIPIGTVLGVLILGARQSEIEAQANT